MIPNLEADAHRLVSTFVPRSARDRAAQADFASFFDADGGPVHREAGPDHLTASCVVFDATFQHTLLVFHRKGQFWVQPGGHVEDGDASVMAGALRELREETGIVVDPVNPPLAYDLDHHGLSSRFGACASHLDIGIAVVVDRESALTVSEESEDLRWWPVDALPAEVPPQLVPRLTGLLTQLQSPR
ncbi:NUDIX domain-containing protein [Microbacterium oxydans]|uniref:NUDIX hydrolase n=1 Tax=Microbacterium TaxID=33882 RepID=UPI00076A7DE6|nr:MULTISPECIES: NUDIX domain-containing protein [unclassified Microbacterium]MBE7956034.1 NUDIX domain-containing protein [Microbacterium sp. R1]NYF28662.1 8-oxo-dGTP pyrophosphatase MutT (NUDIX family) [Microbacterium sp. JAI119]RBO70526.1 NUDIX domain-containing protein [Microbacterium sp. H6]